MMLLGRWVVAAMLGIGLVMSGGNALGQSSSKPGRVVQPDDGPPPDQALQPEPAAQYEHASDPAPQPDPEPIPEPPAPDPPAAELPPMQQAAQPAPEPAPEPAVQAETPAPAAPVQQTSSPAPVIPAGNGVQNQLQKDTATLLQLAEDLKTEIEKAGSNTLSLVAIRKVDEIQRLTKNLRERMRDQEQVTVSK